MDPFNLNHFELKRVENTLEKLDIQQLAGQMLIPRIVYGAPKLIEALQKCYEFVDTLQVGGFYVAGSNAVDQMMLMKQLNSRSKLPLFFCADFEAGVGNIWPQQATRFPYPLALAATGDVEAVRQVGICTGREARHFGVNWSLTPVCDVNVNSRNPIVNIRCFGDSPDQVSRYISAYINSIQSQKIMACAKHFPGQGNTEMDAHKELATILSDEQHLKETDLIPFYSAIQAGVLSIMPGHLWIPNLMRDEGRIPATFSYYALTDLLRKKMGFNGLIITDSMKMHAVANHYKPDEACIKAIKAGADCILLSPDFFEAHKSIVKAVESKDISIERIRESAFRILSAKACLGLNEDVQSGDEPGFVHMKKSQNLRLAESLARSAISIVKDKNHILPLDSQKFKNVFHLALIYGNDWTLEYVQPITKGFAVRFKAVQQELVFTQLRSKWVSAFIPSAKGKSPETLHMEYGYSEKQRMDVLEKAHKSDVTVVSVHIRTFGYKGRPCLIAEHIELLKALSHINPSTVVVAMGSPYLLSDISKLPCLIATFDWSIITAKNLPPALTGEFPIKGKVPVYLPNLGYESHIGGLSSH